MDDWSGFEWACASAAIVLMAVTFCSEGCSVNEVQFSDSDMSSEAQSSSADNGRIKHQPSAICEMQKQRVIESGKLGNLLPDATKVMDLQDSSPECDIVYGPLKHWWTVDRGFTGDKGWQLCQYTRFMVRTIDPKTTPGGQDFLAADLIPDDCDIKSRGLTIYF